MDARVETLIEGSGLIKDLKSRRKSDRITARSLTSIQKNRIDNYNLMVSHHRRYTLFVIKYVFSHVYVKPELSNQQKKSIVRFFNELATSDKQPAEMRSAATRFINTLTGNRNEFKEAVAAPVEPAAPVEESLPPPPSHPPPEEKSSLPPPPNYPPPVDLELGSVRPSDRKMTKKEKRALREQELKKEMEEYNRKPDWARVRYW